MSYRRGDIGRSLFGVPMSEEERSVRESYLYYFGLYPKQGRPTRELSQGVGVCEGMGRGLCMRGMGMGLSGRMMGNMGGINMGVQSMIRGASGMGTSGSIEGGQEIRFCEATNDSLKLKSRVRDISFNSNGGRMFITSKESIISVSPYTLLSDLTLHTKSQSVIPHPIHPDVLGILSTENFPNTIKLFDLRDASISKSNQSRPFFEIICTHDTLTHFTWNPNGNAIVCVDKNSKFSILDIPKYISSPPKPIINHHLHDHNHPKKFINFNEHTHTQTHQKITNLTYDGLGEILILTHTDGTISLHHHEHTHHNIIEKIHSNHINAITHTKNGQLVATGANDHTVQIFDLHEGTSKFVFPRLEGPVSSLAFSWDGKLLAWGTKDPSSSAHIDDAPNYNKNKEDSQLEKNDFYMCVAGVDPCELYFTHKSPFSFTSCAFHPSRYILAFACDVGSATSKNHPIGLFSFE